MMSVYIHIPFCSTICSYCDFCKVNYNKRWITSYLDALDKEIDSTYKDEQVRTLYIGGGTPTSLDIDELEKLFKIIKRFDLSKLEEFTIECNIENLTREKLILFKNNKVNRLSIGVQSFNQKHLKYLNRNYDKKQIFKIIEESKKLGFDNINVDLIYAIPNETLKELKKDLKYFIKLKISHISTYSLIVEENTKLYINIAKDIDEDLNYEMYKYINKLLIKHGYSHYEVSNYAKDGYQSKHNLVYWNNEHYYGFGVGASSFIGNIRYDNTKSITNYIKGNYIYQKEKLSKRKMMENEMILGLRKLDGVKKNIFYQKYHKKIEDVFEIKDLIKEEYLKEDKNNIYIPEEKIFISNNVLINFIK
jgi:oxygen-independent coproporphyrinogen-3 oxidase